MACDPRAYFDNFASARSDLQRLILLSDVDERKFDELKAGHTGKMTIPYINVPAEGTFDYMKQRTNQVRRILKIDAYAESNSTIIASTLSGNGLEAYRACLRGERASIEADPSTIFDRVVILVVKWSPERGQTGEISNVLLTQGNIKGNYDGNIEPNGQTIIRIERDPDNTCDISLTINDYAAKIVLPRRPSHELVMEEIVFPPRDQPEVSAWSNHSTGYHAMSVSQTFHAPPGTEFLLGSHKATDVVIDGAQFNPALTVSGDALTVTIAAYADSPVAHHGAGAHGRASVTLLRSQPIQYAS
jgi:hypothetical protein